MVRNDLLSEDKSSDLQVLNDRANEQIAVLVDCNLLIFEDSVKICSFGLKLDNKFFFWTLLLL